MKSKKEITTNIRQISLVLKKVDFSFFRLFFLIFFLLLLLLLPLDDVCVRRVMK